MWRVRCACSPCSVGRYRCWNTFDTSKDNCVILRIWYTNKEGSCWVWAQKQVNDTEYALSTLRLGTSTQESLPSPLIPRTGCLRVKPINSFNRGKTETSTFNVNINTLLLISILIDRFNRKLIWNRYNGRPGLREVFLVRHTPLLNRRCHCNEHAGCGKWQCQARTIKLVKTRTRYHTSLQRLILVQNIQFSVTTLLALKAQLVSLLMTTAAAVLLLVYLVFEYCTRSTYIRQVVSSREWRKKSTEEVGLTEGTRWRIAEYSPRSTAFPARDVAIYRRR